MPEQKSSKPVEAASAAPGEKRAASPPRSVPLARASESGNPDVQQALGNLQTAQDNLAAAHAGSAVIPAAEEHVAQARARLADLGYE